MKSEAVVAVLHSGDDLLHSSVLSHWHWHWTTEEGAGDSSRRLLQMRCLLGVVAEVAQAHCWRIRCRPYPTLVHQIQPTSEEKVGYTLDGDRAGAKDGSQGVEAEEADGHSTLGSLLACSHQEVEAVEHHRNTRHSAVEVHETAAVRAVEVHGVEEEHDRDGLAGDEGVGEPHNDHMDHRFEGVEAEAPPKVVAARWHTKDGHTAYDVAVEEAHVSMDEAEVQLHNDVLRPSVLVVQEQIQVRGLVQELMLVAEAHGGDHKCGS